jgi:hypothetical protein
MTMKIEISVPQEHIESDRAGWYVARAFGAIGFYRGETPVPAVTLPTPAEPAPQRDKLADAIEAAEDEPTPAAEAPKRERGKPSPGRARRTKEEIAEDEAADAAETEAPAEEKPLISTGEERIDPTTAEDAAQDKADEQAEAEATAPATLTHDSVRDVLGRYVKAYGMEATMTDGPAIFAKLFGEGKAKVSDIPDAQEDLARAVAAIEAALTENPFDRKAVA